MNTQQLKIGTSPLHTREIIPQGEILRKQNREWYRISDYDCMEPFFMSVTNPDNIWMFLSSTGGISAGRESRDNALFPYYTVDKITENFRNTGPVTRILVTTCTGTYFWEPLLWDAPELYNTSRNLYKAVYGDAVLFEEINHDLGITFSYSWEASPGFGIHRGASITADNGDIEQIRILDGIRNILPASVHEQLQTGMSNLLNAYKRNESDLQTGLGIYTLNATLTDQAEPSESLRATTVWSYGITDFTLLLSEAQTGNIMKNMPTRSETDIRGQRGAYICDFTLTGGNVSKSWGMVGELKQDHRSVHNLRKKLLEQKSSLETELEEDLRRSRNDLIRILELNDGLQEVGSKESQYHHSLNVLFNVMRGGYFLNGYTINGRDFADFVQEWNSHLHRAQSELLSSLPSQLSIRELQNICQKSGDPDLIRMSFEYLPLNFSRRHGDPSRPWNMFFIKTRDENNEPVTGYQGNWRDIFQNWEALCFSYPQFYLSVITKFLNATTIDGYNPYRISQKGIDWEVPEPENPWANIGYWSDHQIIYLTKLLENAAHFLPEGLSRLFHTRMFTFARVPYRIADFSRLEKDPYNSISFDYELDESIASRRKELGADAALIPDGENLPMKTGFLEKLFILLLAKAANYVPGGGIWMNTQRPEWNDANNALAGWGLSMVTLSYLLRFIEQIESLLNLVDDSHVEIHEEVYSWLEKGRKTFQALPDDAHSDPQKRYSVLKELGTAAGQYRKSVYDRGFSGKTVNLKRNAILEFLTDCKTSFIRTIDSTRMEDGSFESYMVLELRDRSAKVHPLYPMLEGQVAGLSLDIYPSEEIIRILDLLKKGPLYREDQKSYMLYPYRHVSRFLDKNSVTEEHMNRLSPELKTHPRLQELLIRDDNGSWHFHGDFRNAGDLEERASFLSESHRAELLRLFEEIFQHRMFTGRSGTFFAYEGLGSIYWHMVSKLLLAVQERLTDAVLRGDSPESVSRLKRQYIDIRRGLGFNKTPLEYGAVPLDPYSHSPWEQGAKQPGMTGQVKEEVLTRFAELGMVIRDGRIFFMPELILDDQWIPGEDRFSFQFCGIRFTVARAKENRIEIDRSGEESVVISGLEISEELSRNIFLRDGSVTAVTVTIKGGK
ncbi:hypothetical protein [Salinispira pacifica]|uniref:Cellobiose phosphorylase n=1 Tax=Salinispira pacifica TaxID=1307761 RepID=V5WEX7_9SPIO|nr:hypothetical protein [Salinispira pacifica]AHC14185.1 hypothetical protein L21SP2_0760 [Salinispira pacifica]